MHRIIRLLLHSSWVQKTDFFGTNNCRRLNVTVSQEYGITNTMWRPKLHVAMLQCCNFDLPITRCQSNGQYAQEQTTRFPSFQSTKYRILIFAKIFANLTVVVSLTITDNRASLRQSYHHPTDNLY